ncbi:MAG: site-specific integrase, partial [Cyclobacteriaceae bacterium]|nr:site-specific integrase [Cyclobacteriaceae bacterium]
QRHKDTIVLFKTVAKEISTYLKQSKIKNGTLFPGLTYKGLHAMVMEQFRKIKLPLSKALFSPHSLRHTAGQLLYDDGVPIEFIQRTLRHTSMQSTLVYAQKAIERSYFKEMKKF